MTDSMSAIMSITIATQKYANAKIIEIATILRDTAAKNGTSIYWGSKTCLF